MTEFADFRNVLKKRVKLLEWVGDFEKQKILHCSLKAICGLPLTD